MSSVFISYRRDDSKGFAGALLRELNSRIGADHVFMDFEDIQGGTDFPTVLKEAVSSSDVLLALIGPRWLDARNAQGVLRLTDASDYVRQEISLALQTGARVIPVLVDGAQMPAVGQLPAELLPLATRNALELSNHRWDEDVARLIDHVREGLYALGVDKAANAQVAPDFSPIPAMSEKVKAFSIVCLGLGALFAAVAAGLIIDQSRFTANSQRTEAEVIGNLKWQGKTGAAYSPELRFSTAGGKSVLFVSSLGSGSPSYEVGQKVSILYDPLHPEAAVIDSFMERWFVATILVFFSAIFLSIGLAIMGVRGLRRRTAHKILKLGKPIATSFYKVEQNTRFSVNKKHPFIIVTDWRNPVSKELVRFRSDSIWEDPTAKARNRMITVVVDPNNFHRYIMDLSFLNSKPKPKARDL